MRCLIACEESQIVTKAFRALGHEAYSCDLQACSGGRPDWHIMHDAVEVAYSGCWDMMIAHPPCTYLCIAGAQYLHDVVNNPKRPGDHILIGEARRKAMYTASEFFKKLLNSGIQKIAIENPVPHKSSKLPKYSQIIHPWQYGVPITKPTCIWLRGLPALYPTDRVLPDKHASRLWRVRGPEQDRPKLRAKTFPGIALAMAEQWGRLENLNQNA